MPVEYPIAPNLDTKGRFASLASLLGDAAKPIPLSARKPTYDFNMEGRADSVSVLAQLGIAPVFSVTTSYEQRVMVWDAQVGYWAQLQNPGKDDSIYETQWCFGARVQIIYRALEIEANASVPTIAATAEFKGANVQYKISATGLGPKELADMLREIPPVGRFDMTTYSKLVVMRNRLRESMLERLDSLGNDSSELAKLLQPTVIRLDESPFQEPVVDAAAYRFTMQSIEAGQHLNATLNRLRSVAGGAWDEAAVERIFREELGNNVLPNTPPNQQQIGRAREWLRF